MGWSSNAVFQMCFTSLDETMYLRWQVEPLSGDISLLFAFVSVVSIIDCRTDLFESKVDFQL